MKKKLFRNIATVVSAAVIAAGATLAFAGCTSQKPEVAITYEFNGESYEVGYILSRSDAPETVQHFIELADAGYYDGTCIHDYADETFLYGGGYFINEDGELQEKDYFTEVKELEKAGATFTQSVYKTDKETPLYTVVGEFSDNRRGPENRINSHTKGALVMYYPDFVDNGVNFDYDVYVERADGGEANDGDASDIKKYCYNSATSLFYTFLGQSRPELDEKYAVFGKVADFDGEMQPLLTAISEYTNDLGKGKTFTTPSSEFGNGRLFYYGYDHTGDDDFESLRRSLPEVNFNTPLTEPILIKSVRVTKY